MKKTINVTNINPNKINNYDYLNNSKLYKILYYDDNYICNDDLESGVYRSVIVSMPERKLLAYAPPKTVPLSLFKSINPLSNNIVIHEFIDGIMLQVFYDKSVSSWKLHPVILRNNIFDNQLDEKAFIIASQGNENKPFKELAILEYFPKNYSYTFIIKKQVSFQSSLYLISVYKICSRNEVQFIPQEEYENWDVFSNISGIICFPKQDIISGSYNELVDDIYYNYCPNKWVLTDNKTGMQTTISTNEYNLNKQLSMLNRNQLFQYLCLYRISKVDEYMKLFPHSKKEMYTIKQTYDWFIRTVHEIYINYYILKSLDKIPDKYKIYVTEIHQYYYLYPKRIKESKLITKNIVKEYFNKKNPWNLLTILLPYNGYYS